MMGIRCMRVAAVCAITAVSLGGPVASGAAELAEQPIFPSAPLVLTKTDDGFTASIPVSNPTTETFKIAAAVVDDQQGAKACSAEIPTKSSSVKPSTSTVLKVTIAERDPGCLDPAKGKGHTIELTATSGAAGAKAIPIVLELAEGTPPAVGGDKTGIIWPDEPVFLKRRDGSLQGEFTVVNPTRETIYVTPPSIGADCKPVVPSPSPVQSVAPSDTAQIKFTITACPEFDSGALTVTASAKTKDKEKAEVTPLVLKAEVDWDHLPWWFLGIFVGSAVLVYLAAGKALEKRNKTAAANSKVAFTSPLIVEADAPKSWLTAVAGVGPLLVTLASTTDLTEGLTGSDAIPQSTLIAAVSAFALFLVGVAGLIGNAPWGRATVGEDKEDCPLVWQFALSAAIMATSAGITIWAFATAVSRLDLGLRAITIIAITGLAATVLVMYLFQSVYHYIEVYAGPLPEEPDVPTPSAELIAAATQALAPYYLGNPPSKPCECPPTYDCDPPDGDSGSSTTTPTGSTFATQVDHWIDGSLLAATNASKRAAQEAKEAADEAKKAAKEAGDADQKAKRAEEESAVANKESGEAARKAEGGNVDPAIQEAATSSSQIAATAAETAAQAMTEATERRAALAAAAANRDVKLAAAAAAARNPTWTAVESQARRSYFRNLI